MKHREVIGSIYCLQGDWTWVSVALIGDESLVDYLRLQTSIEIFENSAFCAKHSFFPEVYARSGSSFAS